MDRRERAGRQHRPLHALLSVFLDEHAEVGEVAELGFVDRRLGADRERFADLRDHDADLTGRHLHPRMFRHRKDQPQLEAQPRHQQFGLIAGFAAERQRVVAGQLRAESPPDQSDLGRPDAVDGAQTNGGDRRGDESDGDPDRQVERHGNRS